MSEDAFNTRNKDPYKWLKSDSHACASALRAIHTMLPTGNKAGLEIARGRGPFTVELGIPKLDARPISPPRIAGSGSKADDPKLPVDNHTLDFVFVSCCEGESDELSSIFREAFRILNSKGVLIVAFIDPKSPSADNYIARVSRNCPCDTERIMFDLTHAGFKHFEFIQTLFSPPEELTVIQNPKAGYGEGSFVVVQARKKI